MRFKPRIRNFRCSPELDELLRNAAHEVGAPPSRLLREFVRDGCELIMRDPRLAKELRRKYAVS
jgi:predicted DNA-binding protein